MRETDGFLSMEAWRFCPVVCLLDVHIMCSRYPGCGPISKQAPLIPPKKDFAKTCAHLGFLHFYFFFFSFLFCVCMCIVPCWLSVSVFVSYLSAENTEIHSIIVCCILKGNAVL